MGNKRRVPRYRCDCPPRSLGRVCCGWLGLVIVSSFLRRLEYPLSSEMKGQNGSGCNRGFPEKMRLFNDVMFACILCLVSL